MPWITLNWKSLMREMTFVSLLIRCLTSEMNDFNHSLKGGLVRLMECSAQQTIHLLRHCIVYLVGLVSYKSSADWNFVAIHPVNYVVYAIQCSNLLCSNCGTSNIPIYPVLIVGTISSHPFWIGVKPEIVWIV